MTPSEEIETLKRSQQNLIDTLLINYHAVKNLQQRIGRLEDMSLDIYRRIDRLQDILEPIGKKIKGDGVCEGNVIHVEEKYPTAFRTAGAGEGTGK